MHGFDKSWFTFLILEISIPWQGQLNFLENQCSKILKAQLVTFHNSLNLGECRYPPHPYSTLQTGQLDKYIEMDKLTSYFETCIFLFFLLSCRVWWVFNFELSAFGGGGQKLKFCAHTIENIWTFTELHQIPINF
jgi:hypothetical protein